MAKRTEGEKGESRLAPEGEPGTSATATEAQSGVAAPADSSETSITPLDCEAIATRAGESIARASDEGE